MKDKKLIKGALTNLIIVFSIILYSSCLEEYNPKINDYNELPVVEGMITNEPGPYTIKLSKSMNVYSLNYIPITGAQVIIDDDFNNEEILKELEPGSYYTDSFGIKGIVGHKYRITIIIDGKIYQSSYEELLEPIPIDSVFAKIEYHETKTGSTEGLQFYLNTKPEKSVSYFLWILNETYEYNADLDLEKIYFSVDSVVNANNDTVKTCWETENIYDIFTFSTKNLADVGINNLPLNYVSAETKKLFIKYSLLVKQYSVTKEAYTYWNEIKIQHSESSSLYSKQPYQIKGNIVNVSNPDDIALGYFIVAGISHKRIFVNKPSLNFSFDVCRASASIFEQLFTDPDAKFPAYVTTSSGGLGVADYNCYDCKSKGGTNIKPEFWND